MTTEDTRSAILKCARKLFYSEGYEASSIQSILKELNIARGTLYYHFESKEAILDAILEEQGEFFLSKAKEVAADKSLPADQRLIRTLLALKHSSPVNEDEIESTHKPHNALMHQKSNRLIVELAGPLLMEIVADGVKERIFNCPFPDEVVEMILIYVNVGFDYLEGQAPETIQRKLQGFVYIVHHLLGAEPGSLDFTPLFA